MQEFLRKLKKDKIKINWNKNPITMELFLSFLAVDTERQTRFLGSDTGWTQLTGNDGLEIGGGIINGVEYLDRLQYGEKLDNPYNNYVNPFYIFGILNEAGKKFFLDYYSEDIESILATAERNYVNAKNAKVETTVFWERIKSVVV